MSHTMLFMFDTCACSDTISHTISSDSDTQNVQRSWIGQIKRAVDVPQPYLVRHNNRNARHNQAYSVSKMA